jgi:hypothetical protein
MRRDRRRGKRYPSSHNAKSWSSPQPRGRWQEQSQLVAAIKKIKNLVDMPEGFFSIPELRDRQYFIRAVLCRRAQGAS